MGTECYLGGASLVGADLRYASFEGANAEEARFDGARLDHAQVTALNGRKSRWARASLLKADLREAILVEADLQDTDSRHADLTGAKLDRADLTGARIGHALGTGAPVHDVTVRWIDASSRGDGSERLTNGKIPALLSGMTPIGAEGAVERYFGAGDVLRNASLGFAAGARVRIDGLLEGCTIHLGDDAELVDRPLGCARGVHD